MGFAVIFPGQGSQYKGMGNDVKDLPGAKKVIERASQILGYDILEIMCNADDETLKKTEITQPVVFVYSACYIEAFRDWLTKYGDVAAGHSLGEITALFFADVLALDDAVVLVRERARGMSIASEVPSTMAAVITSDFEKVDEICRFVREGGGVVVPANFNSPTQVVISGEVSAVSKAVEKLKENGIKAIPLRVGGAFHSPIMKPAEEILVNALNNVEFRKARIPVYCNVDAQPHTEPHILKENLKRQLTSPVLWHQTITNMIKDGVNEFVEVGPSSVLSNLINKSYKGVSSLNIREKIAQKVGNE